MSPEIGTGDRLGVMLFMAGALHAAVLLGVGFVVPDGERDSPPLIEVTLTQSPAEEAPDDHDFLAPEHQDGGGEAEQPQRPTEPGALLPDPRDQVAPLSAAPEQQPAPLTEEARTLTSDDADETVPEPEPGEPRPEESPERDQLDAPEQVASDLADTERRIDWDARHPTQKRITARTRSHHAAEYMHQWVERIEQVGTLNYPDQARREGLSGRLIVEVTLDADGSVADVELLEGSGYNLLDDAARRFVEMAAPFPAVPEDARGGRDQLVITRTWRFVSDGTLEAD